MAVVVGVDGWGKGWVAVVLGGAEPQVLVSARFARLATDLAEVSEIVVDIPIGLPEGPTRQADVEARKVLGVRAPSVFPSPPRQAVEQDTYEAALQVTRRLLGRGLSRQAYALRSKILEAESVARQDERVREGHPEVSFWAMAGGRPLTHPKKSWNGQAERRQLLAGTGIVLPDRLPGVGGEVPVDDVLDAAAMAWTAQRVVQGSARCLPDPPEVIAGRSVAIWF